jgi:hypothetical protein|tara:strand:- start:540 stop:992 length:453 start_codon:yes stop_codon:yes gene_type:complete
MYRFIPAKEGHIPALIADMAPDTKNELEALRPGELLSTVRQCICDSTEAWSAFDNGKLICCFGITRKTLLSDTGHPWIIVTNRLQKHKKDFLYLSKIGIKYWLIKYGRLENWVPVGFDKILRWIKWAGFTVYPAEQVSDGRMFHRIEMRK